MVAGNLSRYRVLPGQAQEFRALITEYRQYLEGFGAKVQLRRTVFAGDGVGTVSMMSLYPDADARAESLDRILADVDNNPVAAQMTSATPPATLESRTLVDSVDPVAAIPAQANILRSVVFKASVATQAAGANALLVASARHNALGASAIAWRFATGPNRGSFLYGVGVDSMKALQEFDVKNRGLDEPPPLLHAGQAGVLTPENSQISRPYIA